MVPRDGSPPNRWLWIAAADGRVGDNRFYLPRATFGYLTGDPVRESWPGAPPDSAR